MTTPAWIEELERLEKAATPGPWELDGYMPNSEIGCAVQIIGPAGVLFESSNCATRMTDYEADEHGTNYWDAGSRPNFAFVAALRNAAPALIALARSHAALVEVARAAQQVQGHYPQRKIMLPFVKGLRAALAALPPETRAEVEGA